MADLITLQGTAQQTGKKVTGYKFPDNLNDLKFPFKLIWHPNYTPILRGSDNVSQVNIPASKQIVFVKKEGEKSKQNEKLITKEGYILNVSKVDKSKLLISPDKISSDTIPNIPVSVTKAPTSTSTSNSTLEEDLNNSPLGKTARKIQIGFSVVGWGVFGILAYKFWNKSMTWKVMLSVFGAYNLYSTYKIFSKPALKVSGGSDSNTGTTTGTTTGTLNKSQKVDLIVNSMSDPEQKGLDDFNRKFMNTLTDAELNTWIKLSKALKDTSLQAGDKQQVYKILLTKYNVSQKEFDDSMKKWGEALMGGFEQGLQEGIVNASEQVFEEGFTNQNQSAFSNFESSLNLDL